MTDKEIIVKKVPLTEMLAQLAEEASELAQAALKLRRAIEGVNPTPVSVEDAENNLAEEWGDVMLCVDVMCMPEEFHRMAWRTSREKASRWAGRMSKRRAMM